MNEKTLISKVKKLLALSSNNPSEEEANTAYAKAQELIAQYGLEYSEDDEEKLNIVFKKAEHYNNEGYRKPLAVIIARNFKVKTFCRGNDIYFYGIEVDVDVAIEVYNHAYKYSHRRGIKLRNDARKSGLSTKGVSTSYWLGFMAGLRDILDEQCMALMITVPNVVEEAWKKEIVPTIIKGRKGLNNTQLRGNYYTAGYEEGKEYMGGRKSIAG